MDLNDIRSVLTVACLAAFLALVAWAFSKQRRAEFDAAALAPLASDTPVDGETHGAQP